MYFHGFYFCLTRNTKQSLIYFYIFICFLCVLGPGRGKLWNICRGQQTACGSRFSPSTICCQGCNSGCQAWWQVFLPTESSQQPLNQLENLHFASTPAVNRQVFLFLHTLISICHRRVVLVAVTTVQQDLSVVLIRNSQMAYNTFFSYTYLLSLYIFFPGEVYGDFAHFKSI